MGIRREGGEGESERCYFPYQCGDLLVSDPFLFFPPLFSSVVLSRANAGI